MVTHAPHQCLRVEISSVDPLDDVQVEVLDRDRVHLEFSSPRAPPFLRPPQIAHRALVHLAFQREHQTRICGRVVRFLFQIRHMRRQSLGGELRSGFRGTAHFPARIVLARVIVRFAANKAAARQSEHRDQKAQDSLHVRILSHPPLVPSTDGKQTGGLGAVAAATR